MQFSRVLFRIFFVVLAITYTLVLFDFIDLSRFDFAISVSPEVIIMTLLASLFVYFYLRKPKL